ncbi:hypothetical protein LTR85_010380 [Meristemomyces frigidus]|nr:hypothetical protein LTR85_010380 [Meristemomyces frigidus]
MADGSAKRLIPAWQQRPRQNPPASSADNDQPTKQAADTEESIAAKQEESGSDTSIDAVGEEESAPPPEGTSQLDMVEAFLADPDVKKAPLEKKRAFLQSKEISVETIDQVLKPESNAFETSDFEAFKQQQQQQTAPKASPPPSQRPTGPPIITYPEFLMEAHKAPPLITPARILGATYIAGGLATLAYGASKYIVNPMIEGMTEARHDFASHSQSKLDEFNNRLSRIVSKVPEAKKDPLLLAPEIEVSEVDSVTSDPTELYHRDMGTQTSPGPSRRSSEGAVNTADTPAPVKKDAVAYQTIGLTILKDHLSELLLGVDKQEATNKERQESVNKLRHYLDTVIYGSPAVSAWSTSEEAMTGKVTPGKKEEVDGVEELKREIRGVKGVLLSARRFPAAGGVGGRVGGGG